MSETLVQHGLSMSQTFFCPSKLISHVQEIPTAEILEFPSLEQIPDPVTLSPRFLMEPKQVLP